MQPPPTVEHFPVEVLILILIFFLMLSHINDRSITHHMLILRRVLISYIYVISGMCIPVVVKTNFPSVFALNIVIVTDEENRDSQVNQVFFDFYTFIRCCRV